MDPVLGRAVTVLAACALFAVAYLFRDNAALVFVLTNAGTGMLGTLLPGAGLVSKAKADEMVAKASIRPPAP